MLQRVSEVHSRSGRRRTALLRPPVSGPIQPSSAPGTVARLENSIAQLLTEEQQLSTEEVLAIRALNAEWHSEVREKEEPPGPALTIHTSDSRLHAHAGALAAVRSKGPVVDQL